MITTNTNKKQKTNIQKPHQIKKRGLINTISTINTFMLLVYDFHGFLIIHYRALIRLVPVLELELVRGVY